MTRELTQAFPWESSPDLRWGWSICKQITLGATPSNVPECLQWGWHRAHYTGSLLTRDFLHQGKSPPPQNLWFPTWRSSRPAYSDNFCYWRNQRLERPTSGWNRPTFYQRLILIKAFPTKDSVCFWHRVCCSLSKRAQLAPLMQARCLAHTEALETWWQEPHLGGLLKRLHEHSNTQTLPLPSMGYSSCLPLHSVAPFPPRPLCRSAEAARRPKVSFPWEEVGRKSQFLFAPRYPKTNILFTTL